MKLGIKVAPGNAWQQDIEATQPAMVEIWYNASHPELYTGLFAYLADKPIAVGLHFWGALPNGLLTNISYPDKSVSGPSLELMHNAIDVAATHGCAYMNIHPDLYALLTVNFDTMDVRVTSAPSNCDTVRKAFIRQTLLLDAYAKSKGVLLTVETVPLMDTPSWKPDRDRTRAINLYQLPITVHLELARRGIAIANDFCHTACNMITTDRTAIWNFVFETTKKLAPATRLIHLGFLVPPYNGVDFHDHLDNPVFESSEAIPNRNEMRKLLNLFAGRDDVYILAEPKDDHIKNYRLAQKLL